MKKILIPLILFSSISIAGSIKVSLVENKKIETKADKATINLSLNVKKDTLKEAIEAEKEMTKGLNLDLVDYNVNKLKLSKKKGTKNTVKLTVLSRDIIKGSVSFKRDFDGNYEQVFEANSFSDIMNILKGYEGVKVLSYNLLTKDILDYYTNYEVSSRYKIEVNDLNKINSMVDMYKEKGFEVSNPKFSSSKTINISELVNDTKDKFISISNYLHAKLDDKYSVVENYVEEEPIRPYPVYAQFRAMAMDNKSSIETPTISKETTYDITRYLDLPQMQYNNEVKILGVTEGSVKANKAKINMVFRSDNAVHMFKKAMDKLGIKANLSTVIYTYKKYERNIDTTEKKSYVILKVKVESMNLNDLSSMLKQGISIDGTYISIKANTYDEAIAKYKKMNLTAKTYIDSYKKYTDEKIVSTRKEKVKELYNEIQVEPKDIKDVSMIVALAKAANANVEEIMYSNDGYNEGKAYISAIENAIKVLGRKDYSIVSITDKSDSGEEVSIQDIYSGNKKDYQEITNVDELIKEATSEYIYYNVKDISSAKKLEILFKVGK